MWEQTKAELDAIFRKNNKVIFERRNNGHWSQFGDHLEHIRSFAAVQERVIRPTMNNFGSYVDRMGHKHYIESAERLVDGHLLPVSNISLHVLLVAPPNMRQDLSHSITFKTDGSRVVYLYEKRGNYAAENPSTTDRYPVGKYSLNQLTPDLVESHLKDFLVRAILAG